MQTTLAFIINNLNTIFRHLCGENYYIKDKMLLNYVSVIEPYKLISWSVIDELQRIYAVNKQITNFKKNKIHFE